MFGCKSGEDKVLKLKKSMCRLKQSPRTSYQYLNKGIQKRGWIPSAFNPCLFMKEQMICFIYVDDTIFIDTSE